MAMIRSHSSSVSLGRRLDLLLDAGVVEGDVEAPERFDRLLQRRLHVLGRASRRTGRRARGRRTLRSGEPSPGCPRSAMSATTTLAPCARERQRRGAADAARRTGHERDLAREAPVLIHRNPSVARLHRRSRSRGHEHLGRLPLIHGVIAEPGHSRIVWASIRKCPLNGYRDQRGAVSDTSRETRPRRWLRPRPEAAWFVRRSSMRECAP